LQHVGTTLSSRARRGDVVARVGGDEFVLLLRALPGETAVDAIADDVLKCVADPHEHDGLRLSLDASMGVTCGPADGADLSTLLARADAALRQAKNAPGSFRRWKQEREEHSRDRLALSADLRTGLDNDELILHYQPQIDTRSGAVVCVEALARWQHPTRGLLTPNVFVGIAETTGLARRFTLAVLEAAVTEAARWRADGLGNGEVAIAVNLSARNLLDRELPTDVAVVLARHGLPARLLVLEITETVVMTELEVIEDVLARLRGLGVQISVDDFGTGFSSLTFLQRVRVNELKIDQNFVQGMPNSEQDLAIVRATIDLAHGLGLRVTAEGVEDQDTLDELARLGCDAVQGYHIARPMPAEVLREMLLPDTGVVVPIRHSRTRRISGS
jgi:EAL domain-containing protein (putative c-di-GMP-specific phosphodiesterase class I)